MTSSIPVDGSIVIASVLLIGAILVIAASTRLRVPAALFSLGLGMLFGSDGLGLVPLDDFELVRNVSIVALIVILFEGGLTTKPSAVREAGWPGLVLATLGVALTATVTGAAVVMIFGLDWTTGLLLGAVVASTDAAVVFALVRRTPIPKRLASILEVESGANDPTAIVLTVGLLAMLEGAAVGVGDWASFGIRQLGGGVLAGIVVGVVARWLLNLDLPSISFYPVMALGLAGAAYGGAAVLGASGFLAVYVTGLIVGATVPRQRRAIRNFLASLANGADVGLFLLLGLLVFPSQLPGVAGPALVVTAVLIFIARPLAVLVSMSPFRLPAREQVVLSWAGLKGAVPIVLATFPASAGVEGGQTIFNVVFFVVLTSTLVQGTTTEPLVRRLGLEADVPPWRSVAETLPLDVPNIDLVEVVVEKDLALAGQTLRDYPPGRGLLVVAVLRDGHAILPTGDLVIMDEDKLVLSIDLRQRKLTDVTAWARGEME